MRGFCFYCMLLVMSFLVGCSSDENLDNNFTLTGCIVSSPHNAPVSNCVVEVTNGNTALASTITNEDGLFKLTIDINMLDNTYYLAISDNQYGNKKQEKIQGVGISIYDYGNIVIYDSKNPCQLPTFSYGGNKYIAHPVLRKQYYLYEVNGVCENLDDYGINAWFLPNINEMQEIYHRSPHIKQDLEYGDYWTSDINANGRAYLEARFASKAIYTDDPYKIGYILPIALYE